MLQPDNSLKTTVFRKPITQICTCSHMVITTWLPSLVPLTCCYIEPRLSVLIISCSRRKKTTSNKHYKNGSTLYGLWMANIKLNGSNKGSSNSWNNPMSNINKSHIVVPYIKGLSDSCKNICGKHGIQMHLKGGRDNVIIVQIRDHCAAYSYHSPSW